MRVAVTEDGLASATEAFVSGNELAARAALTLVDRLEGCAGMAGDDSTAQAFAAAYDETATTCCAALEDLVGALGSLARLTEASLTNHGHADARATLPGWARPVVGRPTVADRAVGVRLGAPASSLGASDGPPGGPAGVVLDLLQDVWWPNADTDRVRAAARAWRAAGESAGLVVAHCGSAAGALEGERSPEIPLALAATGALRDRADRLATHLGAVADSCDAYAEQVETHRRLLLDLLEELVEELAIGAVISGGLTVLSGGAAGALAGAAGAARLAAAGARVRAVLERLRLLTSGTALTLRPVAAGLADTSRALRPMRDARVVLMEGRAGQAAVERRTTGGLLSRSEGPGRGHSLERHSSKSVEFLYARVLRHPTASHASSFADDTAAERHVGALLSRRTHEIGEWLSAGRGQLRLEDDMGEVTGISVSRSGDVLSVRGLRAILVRDPAMPEGYWVKTAYPQP